MAYCPKCGNKNLGLYDDCLGYLTKISDIICYDCVKCCKECGDECHPSYIRCENCSGHICKDCISRNDHLYNTYKKTIISMLMNIR